MKILILSPKPPWPPHDGGAVATLRCMEGLAANGATVSLLAMKTEKHVTADSNNDIHAHDILEKYLLVPVDTSIRPLKMFVNLLLSREPYDLVRFRSPKYNEVLRSLLSENDYDIIQCEGLPFALYLNEIRKVTSTPVVLRAHNLEHKIREMTADHAANPVRRAYLRNLSRRLRHLETGACRLFDAVVPIGEPDYRWFRDVSPESALFLSETGAPNAEYVPEPNEVNLRVGFIGALNWQPNIDGIRWFLTKVWPCVSCTVSSATLHIAGRGARRSDRHWIRGTNVIFEGEVDDSRTFMTSMNVMIAPLFAGSGLRIKIVEAMSLGKTVVATPVAASGLPVEDGQEILIAGDSESFCTVLISVLRNAALRASTGQAAVALVRERYDNRTQTRELAEFYRRLRNDS